MNKIIMMIVGLLLVTGSVGSLAYDSQYNIHGVRSSFQMKTLDTHQQLFAITAEECGELVQVCMKILRKAQVDDEWNAKLLEEAGDVYCMLDLMVQHGYLTWDDITKRSSVKKSKLMKWSDLIPNKKD